MPAKAPLTLSSWIPEAEEQELLEPIRRPWFLAGGLSPENAADAIRRLAPYGVDVSSGIETDGVKDIQKMNDFVRAVRGAAERKL